MMEPTKYRGSLQLIYAILRNARKASKQSKLMSETRIGHKTLFRFLPLLLERGLVEEVPYVSDRGKRMSKVTPYLYVITDKGEALIKLFERIYDILGWIESSLGDRPRGNVNG